MQIAPKNIKRFARLVCRDTRMVRRCRYERYLRSLNAQQCPQSHIDAEEFTSSNYRVILVQIAAAECDRFSRTLAG